ncbi:hypothetical protein BH24GEM3_BH24GEM3_10790 [soil metagenome]
MDSVEYVVELLKGEPVDTVEFLHKDFAFVAAVACMRAIAQERADGPEWVERVLGVWKNGIETLVGQAFDTALHVVEGDERYPVRIDAETARREFSEALGRVEADLRYSLLRPAEQDTGDTVDPAAG